MSVGQALTRGRRAAERLMADRCIITRAGDPGAFDPDSGSTGAPTDTGAIYEGACRVRSRNASEALAAEQQVGVHTFVVSLPWHVTQVERDDTVTLTESADPWLVNRPLTVTDVAGSTHSTARRLLCTT